MLDAASHPASPAALSTPCPDAVAARGSRPSDLGNWRARLLVSRAAYRREPAGKVAGVLHSSSGRESDMRWGLVVGMRRVHSTCRLGVQLPERPNGRVAWIDAQLVRTTWSPWRIEVTRSSRRATLVQDGRPLRSFSVDVGKPSTPTPAGRFAVLWVVPNEPQTSNGAWILALSAESNVVHHYDGGPGRIGLHGRGGASLFDPLGAAVSHGCVRFTNRAIRWIVARVGAPNLPGVAVEID